MNSIRVKTGSAITVVNAIALGKGAAIGIEANNIVTISKSDNLEILTFPEDNDNKLIQTCLEEFSKDQQISPLKIRVETEFELPPAKGLKTSSAVSCALLEGLYRHYELPVDYETIIKMSAKCTIKAGVSITGAIDDAWAAHFGGYFVTDNLNRSILFSSNTPFSHYVYLLIPQDSTPKSKLPDLSEEKNLTFLDEAIRYAMEGEIESAIAKNTEFYSPHLLKDETIIEDLSKTTTSVVGINGAGPSIFVLAKRDNTKIKEHISTSYPEYRLFESKTRRREVDI